MATPLVRTPVIVLNRTRRLLFALGSSLLVVVAALAVTAMANAGGELPETFQLAARHGGDKGEWVVDFGEGEQQTVQAGGASAGIVVGDSQEVRMGASVGPQRESFEWLREEAWRDGSGTWHAVHGRLVTSAGSMFMASAGSQSVSMPLWQMDWVETSTGLLLGTTQVVGGGASSSTTMMGEESSISVRTLTTWRAEAPCGLGDRLREGVELAEPIVVGGCFPEGEVATFRATGVDELEGIEAVRFEATSEARETLTFWFNPGIPEPVRVLHADAEGHAVDRRLVSFTAGSEPWDAGTPLPASDDLPDVATKPRNAWGPDDSSVKHPFPLSKAWTLAAEDLLFRDFSGFLARNPEAGAVSAEYSERHDGSATDRTWFIQARGDGEEFALWATQREQYAGGAATDLLGMPPAGPPIHTYSFHGSGNEWPDAAAPDAKAPLPTVASAQAFWQAFTGSKTPANVWGLEECHHSRCEGLAVRAGQAVFKHEEGSGNVTATQIVIDSTGKAVALWQEDTHYTRTAAGMQASAGGQVRLDGAVATLSVGGSAPLALSAVPVTTTASVSFLALLSGLAVWFWPALKSSPLLGLFSRLREDRILEHPVRSRLAALIESQPGIHYQALLRSVGGGKGSLEHHLRKLEEARLVRAVRGPYYTCYFPWTSSGAQRDAAPILKSDGARRVLEAVRAEPGLTGQELSARTGLSASSVSEHVSRLAGAGLLQTTRQGRRLLVQPTPAARDVATPA